jgi:hypothetical protein
MHLPYAGRSYELRESGMDAQSLSVVAKREYRAAAVDRLQQIEGLRQAGRQRAV